MYPSGRPSEVRPSDGRNDHPRHPIIDPRRLLLHDANSAKEIDLAHARIRAFDETVKYMEQVNFYQDGTAVERSKLEKTASSRASTPDSDSDLYVQPLDLTKQSRDADSPLDLSVKTTRRIADTTDLHEPGLVKRHDLLSPRPSGVCDTTNAPRNPKKEKLLQYERVSQQSPQKTPQPQLLASPQHRVQMQHYLQQRQQQQRLPNVAAGGVPKTKESAAVDSTLQMLHQQKLMQAYHVHSALMKGHMSYSAAASPMPTQPMTQGLPHPHVNRVSRPPSKGAYSGREGEIRGSSPAMSPSPRASTGKESPQSVPKVSRPGLDGTRAGTPQIPSKTTPQMHPQLSQLSPATLEQMRLYAMSRRYYIGPDGKPLPGYPMLPPDSRMPNGAVRLPNGMVQPTHTPPPRKRDTSVGKPASSTPLRIEIPDSSTSSSLSDKISPSPAMQPRPSPSYVHGKPRMALSTTRFPAPKPHNRPGESRSPPPLSMADSKTPVAIHPPPPLRGTSPLPSPQMPVLSPHTKSPTVAASPRNSPTISNVNSDKGKGVDLDSKEAVSVIMQQLLPQFVKRHKKRPDETSDKAGGEPAVKETILNVPRPPRMVGKPPAEANSELEASRTDVKGRCDGKTVNAILGNAIKQELQMYAKANAGARKECDRGSTMPESRDRVRAEPSRTPLNQEPSAGIDTVVKNTELKSTNDAPVAKNEQERVRSVQQAEDVNSESKSTNSKEMISKSPNSGVERQENRNEMLKTPTKGEIQSTPNDDSVNSDVKVRPPCGRIVQKTSPAPKVKLPKESDGTNAGPSSTEPKSQQPLVSTADQKNNSPGQLDVAETQASQKQPLRKPGPSGIGPVVPPSQRPPPMRNVWSTIRIENGEISPMPMSRAVAKPVKKAAPGSRESSKGRSGEASKGHRTESAKGRSTESSTDDSDKGSGDGCKTKGRTEPVKKGSAKKVASTKGMAPLMKKTVMMRNKIQERNSCARMKSDDESDNESKSTCKPSGSQRTPKKRKTTAADLRRVQRRRSILDEIANSHGYLGQKKKKETADDLYADPALLDREERALRCAMSKSKRAMIQFSEMDADDDCESDDNDRYSWVEIPNDKEDIKMPQGRKRRSGEKLLTGDSKKRKTAKGSVEKVKKGADGDVLETRTRTQAAATKTGPPLTTYNKNAAYERELKREETKAKLQKAKRLKSFRKAGKRRNTQDSDKTDNGNDAPEPDIGKEAEDDDTRKIFRNKSRSAALGLLWQRRRIEQAKQWSYNSAAKAGGKRKRRSRTKRIKFCRARKSRSAKLAREIAEMQQFGSESFYDFHDDDTCAEAPDTRPVPPEMKRMVVNKNSGETILHRAARLGYEDVVIYCLETGTAAVNARDNAGYTSLHECCVRGHLNIAKYLINYGANVNCSAADGTRPIHDAVDNDHLEVVRLLLSHGSDPLLATYSGRTPLKAARYPKMRAFLKGFLADLNGPNEEEGETLTPWEFSGSSFYSDPTNSGFTIFSDLPSDPEDGDHDIEFEFSSKPHIRTYKLELENENGPKNYVLVGDVLEKLKLSRQEFMERHPKICVCTKRIRSSIFRQQVELSCFDDVTNSAGSISRRQAQFTELLPLDDGVRELLDISVVRVDFINENIQIPRRNVDQEEDMESVMSDDTVIYDADDLGNEADVDEEMAPDESKPTTSRDVDTPKDGACEKFCPSNEVPKEAERNVGGKPDIKLEVGQDSVGVPPAPSERTQGHQPQADNSQERLQPGVYYQRDQIQRQMPNYYRQLPRVMPEGYLVDHRVTSAAVTSASTEVSGQQQNSSMQDTRRAADLKSAMHRSITQAVHQPTDTVSREQMVALTREQMAAVGREQLSKSAVNYQSIPYMYKAPYHSHMRSHVPAVHPYSSPQQYPIGRHPHQPPTTRTDFYSHQYRHSVPQNCHSFQFQQPRSHRDHMQHLGASHSKEMEALAEAKRTTDAMESSYLLKVAPTPEEYFMTYKQRLSANNNSQQFHQRNSLVNGISTPPHPHVPAHVQTRPERLPPYL